MKDNSMLVNSNVQENNPQTYHLDNVVISDKVPFENLGFKFKSKNNELYVILPDGWTIEDSDDGFTLDLIDKTGSDRGKIEPGNYPFRKGFMWLYK